MKNKITFGHCAAFITIFIWGTTFISTKVLLNILSPIEILFIRFLIGYIILWCIYPHHLHLTHKKEELYFMAAGLCGITSVSYTHLDVYKRQVHAPTEGEPVQVSNLNNSYWQREWYSCRRLY